MPEIVLLTEPIDPETLARLVRDGFGDMVKFVADLERGVVAAGGDLHADAEELLLGQGSTQKDLWGANYYPGRPREECVEFTSLINIRPSQGNPSMEITDSSTRARVRELAYKLIGEGGAL
ncbi:MAG TPA: DUF5674 family protein [Candidatus Eisenbacteria bacterium]|nr:DUF5674 family protein [Candidatus Eisenbacteria bacterium]